MTYVPTPGPHPGRQWMPSNGTEGMYFHADWCERCARDKVMNGEVDQDVADERDYCPILTASFTTNEGPIEWREVEIDNRCEYVCTGFIEQGTPEPAARDTQTVDMFGDAP